MHGEKTGWTVKRGEDSEVPNLFFGATLVAFSVALMVFIGLVLLSQRSVQRSREWVNHTLEVQQRLGKLETDLVAAEAGQVAVLLTGD